MKIDGLKVTLRSDEITECPLKPKWAASMIQLYGADSDLKGRLGKFSHCPAVLTEAGYIVAVEEAPKSGTE